MIKTFFTKFFVFGKNYLFDQAGDCDDEKDSTMLGQSNGGRKQQITSTD